LLALALFFLSSSFASLLFGTRAVSASTASFMALVMTRKKVAGPMISAPFSSRR
jgi:hypothetical protein